MNRISITITLAVLSSAVMAQNIRVSYETSAPSFATNRETDKTSMSLVTGAEGSIYYNEMSLYCDSLTSTPEGKKRLSEIQLAAWMTQSPDGGITIDMTRGNAPRKTIYTYVVKDFSTDAMTVFDKYGDEECRYIEPLSEMKWTINDDSVHNILGYECVMATTDYHGRHWVAWFTPEIPVSDGPWKFQGLPGLILSVENSPGFYFEASGIEMTPSSLPPVYSPDSYRSVERRKALADNEHFIKNRDSIISAKYGGRVLHTDRDGNYIKETKYNRQIHAIETDF